MKNWPEIGKEILKKGITEMRLEEVYKKERRREEGQNWTAKKIEGNPKKKYWKVREKRGRREESWSLTRIYLEIIMISEWSGSKEKGNVGSWVEKKKKKKNPKVNPKIKIKRGKKGKGIMIPLKSHDLKSKSHDFSKRRRRRKSEKFQKEVTRSFKKKKKKKDLQWFKNDCNHFNDNHFNDYNHL